MDEAQQHGQGKSRAYTLALSLGALGVVYGDIGTSPLYALRECFMEHHGHRIAPTPANVLGVLSLITWALIVLVSVKYLVFVLRADNRGEGGILSLMSLVHPKRSRRRGVLIGLGLFGSALLYGEGMITPAITVLSAFEGLKVATPLFTPYVVPLTVVALIALFTMQKWGTTRVGRLFGPLMMTWFITLAALGLPQIFAEPHVLAAINPLHAITFLLHHKIAGFLVLGAVVLVVTGGESLYADMGHFGRTPIRIAWFSLVFPCLLINYYGQGALLLRDASATENPFFRLAPQWALYPLVILATMAAVVASQAVISGSYSLTRQAVQLGYLPRLDVRHTSAREIGQIYVPSVNWVLMFCAIAVVIGFRESTKLAGAYGVAVTATMAVTTMIYSVVARERFKWPAIAVTTFLVGFMLIDLSFFSANVIKLADGGWLPLTIGAFVYLLMTTWRRGRTILTDRMTANAVMTEEDFMRDVAAGRIPRVPGTAVFMSRRTEGVPTTMLHNIKHNKVVHQHVVFLSVEVEETPHLSDEERFEWRELGNGIYRLLLRFGFMEDTDIPRVLQSLPVKLVSFDPMRTSYFVGRETLIPTKQPGMAIWREHVFAWMMRNSTSASIFFDLPANQVIELGAQVEL